MKSWQHVAYLESRSIVGPCLSLGRWRPEFGEEFGSFSRGCASLSVRPASWPKKVFNSMQENTRGFTPERPSARPWLCNIKSSIRSECGDYRANVIWSSQLPNVWGQQRTKPATHLLMSNKQYSPVPMHGIAAGDWTESVGEHISTPRKTCHTLPGILHWRRLLWYVI